MARSAGVSTTQSSAAARRSAQRADRLLAEVVALAAAAPRPESGAQRLGQRAGAGAVVLQQVVGHALRRARTDARQHAQRLDQAGKALRGGDAVAVSQKGSLKPAGRPRPAVIDRKSGVEGKS